MSSLNSALEGIAELTNRSLLSFFSGSELSEVLGRSRVITCRSGSRINEGVPDTLSIVLQGTAALFAPEAPSKRITQVIPGRSIELAALFSGRMAWAYIWIAETEMEILQIPWALCSSIFARDPSRVSYLDRMACHREIQQFKNGLTLCGIRESQLFATVNLLTEYEPNGRPLETGHLYLVKTGDLIVTVTLGRERTASSHYSSGDFFFLDPMLNYRFDWRSTPSVWKLDVTQWKERVDGDRVEALVQLGNFGRAQRDAYLRAIEARDQDPEQREIVPDEEEDDLDVTDFHISADELRAVHLKKIRCVLQHDEMDCGAACLSSIARFYGKRISVAEFRSRLDVTKDGTSLLAIKTGASQVGLESIGVEAGTQDLVDLRVPLIAMMQYHFVVVYRITEKWVDLADPAVGLVRYERDRFERDFSRYCLLFRTTAKFHSHPESHSSYWKYLQVFRGELSGVMHTLASSLLIFLMGLLLPFLAQIGVDSIVLGGSTQYLKVYLFLLLASQGLSSLLMWVRLSVVGHLMATLDAKLFHSFLRHLYSLPLKYFSVRRVGDFLARFGELNRIQEFLTAQPISLLLNLLSVVIYSCVLGLYSPRILLLSWAFMPIMGAILFFSTPRLTRIMNEMFQRSVKAASIVFEHFNHLETLRALNAFIPSRWRFQSIVMENQQYALKYATFSALLGLLSSLLHGLSSLVTFVVAIDLFIKGELTLGQVLAVNALAGQVSGPAFALVAQWQGLQQATLSLARVDDVMTAPAERGSAQDHSNNVELKGGISFKNVQFRYGSELSPLVLDNINLEIKPGETVAVVGKSGSGKTTLGFMLNLLYSPTGGQIYYDGIPYSEIPLAQIRKQVATVMQDGRLFTDSLMENIAFGDNHPDFHRVLTAAKAADSHEFISELKDGYLTKLGAGGRSVSGGQAQRIAIARALYRQPKILVLDEATSALDAISEGNVTRNALENGGGRTTIIIAHRLNTVINADRIIVLDRGRIAEIGTHHELIEKQGPYFELLRLQMGMT